jgi:hypothetical protein
MARRQHSKNPANNGRITKATASVNAPDTTKPASTFADTTAATTSPPNHFDPALLPMLEAAPGGTIAPDPFNAESLRIPMDLDAALGVRGAILRIAARKPAPGWFFRVNPDPAFNMVVGIIELKDSQEVYAVAPALEKQLNGESLYSRRVLFACVTTDGTPFLWPVRLPKEGRRIDLWSQSALDAIGMAKKTWIRLDPNTTAGHYNVVIAPDDLGEPKWPEMTFLEMVTLAFRGSYINSLDHVIVRRLQGRRPT